MACMSWFFYITLRILNAYNLGAARPTGYVMPPGLLDLDAWGQLLEFVSNLWR